MTIPPLYTLICETNAVPWVYTTRETAQKMADYFNEQKTADAPKWVVTTALVVQA
jgi:hypothetical protein